MWCKGEKDKVDLRPQTWTTGGTAVLGKVGKGKGSGFRREVVNSALGVFESTVLMGLTQMMS